MAVESLIKDIAQESFVAKTEIPNEMDVIQLETMKKMYPKAILQQECQQQKQQLRLLHYQKVYRIANTISIGIKEKSTERKLHSSKRRH
uniref:Uncharacterized protein n=1 Tax=Romanomermis culicivorax TaxID=13658 RepID=A0A915IA51_ROMCU